MHNLAIVFDSCIKLNDILILLDAYYKHMNLDPKPTKTEVNQFFMIFMLYIMIRFIDLVLLIHKPPSFLLVLLVYYLFSHSLYIGDIYMLF